MIDESDQSSTDNENESENGGEAEAQEPSKKKLPIVIIVVVLVLLSIGGGAAFFLMKSPQDGGSAGSIDGISSKLQGGDSGKTYIYFEMKEPIVTNIRPSSGEKSGAFLKLSVTFQIESGKEQLISSHMAKVRGMFITYLRDLRQEDLQGAEGHIYVKRRAFKTR